MFLSVRSKSPPEFVVKNCQGHLIPLGAGEGGYYAENVPAIAPLSDPPTSMSMSNSSNSHLFLEKPKVGMLFGDDVSLNSVAAVRLLHPRPECVLQVKDRLPNMLPAPLGSGSCTPQHLLLGREAGRFH